jgi:hypothetical protein
MHITAFAAAFLSAALFLSLNSDGRTSIKKIILPALILTSCIAWDFYYITGAPSFDKRELFPAIAVNSIMEHLPKGVLIDKIEKNRDPHKETRFSVKGGGKAEVVSWKSAERILDVNADEALAVRFSTFNFPGWTAYMDGDRENIKTEADTGAIMVNVPKGYHRLKLVFQDTPARKAGKMISLVSLIALFSILIVVQFRKEP